MGRGAREVELVSQILIEARATKEAQAKEAHTLLARARAVQEAIASNFWDLGDVLAELAARKLHFALGYRRFEHMVRDHLGLSKSLIWRLVAIARKLPKELALRLGQERAHALITYAEASEGEVDPVEAAQSDRPLIGALPLSQTPIRDLLAARSRPPRTLAQRARDSADRALATAVKRRAGELGILVTEVGVQADRVVLTMSRAQAQRLAEHRSDQAERSPRAHAKARKHKEDGDGTR